jgi:hypothetical protein
LSVARGINYFPAARMDATDKVYDTVTNGCLWNAGTASSSKS